MALIYTDDREGCYTTHPLEVPCERTPLRFEQARDAFAEAYAHEFFERIDVDTLAVLLAQSALETGRWKFLRRCNFGNKKASLSYTGLHQYYPPGAVNELIDDDLVWFDPPHPQTRFRAYATARDGAIAYVRFLGIDTNGGGNRYQRAWDAAVSGDAEAFARQLSRLGYCTANTEPYVRGVVALAAEYTTALDGYVPTEPEPEEHRPRSCPPLPPLAEEGTPDP